MSKAMITQPREGISTEEIEAVRSNAVADLHIYGYTAIDSYFPDIQVPEGTRKDIAILSKSIEALAEVDILYVCNDWLKDKHSRAVVNAALYYGVDIVYEAAPIYPIDSKTRAVKRHAKIT